MEVSNSNYIYKLAHLFRLLSAEAVQVGHVGSALGMAGIWTVAVHEDGTFAVT